MDSWRDAFLTDAFLPIVISGLKQPAFKLITGIHQIAGYFLLDLRSTNGCLYDRAELVLSLISVLSVNMMFVSSVNRMFVFSVNRMFVSSVNRNVCVQCKQNVCVQCKHDVCDTVNLSELLS